MPRGDAGNSFCVFCGVTENCLLQELEALKSELEDSLDTTAAVQDLRQKREVEVTELKKRIDDDNKHHEAQMQDVRHKHAQQVDLFNEQLDQIKKVSSYEGIEE